MRVGAVHDPLEAEADRVAESVVASWREPAWRPISPPPSTTRIQRAPATLDGIGPGGGTLDPATASRLRSSSGGEPLPATLRDRLESHLGPDLSAVRIHRASPLAPQLNARAFTFGNRIHFAPGTFDPSSRDGVRLIAHEVTHTVQQGAVSTRIRRAGRVPSGGRIQRAEGTGRSAVEGEDELPVGRPVASPVWASVAAGTRIQRKVGVEIEIADMLTAEVRRPVSDTTEYDRSDIGPRDYIASPTEAMVADDRSRSGVNVAKLGTDRAAAVAERNTWGTFFTWGGRAEADARISRIDERIANQDFSQRSLAALKKKDRVIVGNRWTLEADQEVRSGLSNAEFVTDPFEDDQAGGLALSRAMDEIVKCFVAINAFGTSLVPAETIAAAGHGTAVANRVVRPGGGSFGIMQVTVGLRPDRIATLMMEMGGRRTGESDAAFDARRGGRMLMGSGLESFGNPPTDTTANITGLAPALAARALAVRSAGDGWPATLVRGDTLQGIVALATQVIVTAASPIGSYAKSISPLMARTDYGTLFGTLSRGERFFFGGPNSTTFVKLVMTAVHLRDAALRVTDPLIASLYNDAEFHGKVATGVLAGPTRRKWLTGIAEGRDHLTAAHFDKVADDRATSRNEHLESMGAMQGPTGLNPVGAARGAGAIFEIRTVGRKPVGLWPATAFDIFRYVRTLNDGGAGPAASTVVALGDAGIGDLFSDTPETFAAAVAAVKHQAEQWIRANL